LVRKRKRKRPTAREYLAAEGERFVVEALGGSE